MLRSLSLRARKWFSHALAFCAALWRRFRALPRWGQALVVALIIAVLFGLSALFGGNPNPSNASAQRTVTLRSIAELSGNASGASVIGVVRSRSEAELRAEAAGTVRAVYTSLGATVGAGTVIAELENESERAQVTQAEGAYDAALAARAAVSPVDVVQAGRNAYRTAFDTLDTAIETQIDQLFGELTPYGPRLLVNPVGSDNTALPRERAQLEDLMDAERSQVGSANTRDPEALLAGIAVVAQQAATLADKLALAVNANNSNATPAQIAAVVAARTSITGVLSSVTAAQASLRSGSAGSAASVDAAVKSALGTLRLAQATLEKTRIRAPIAGTVNYLPIRVGDYVGNLDHVATVAQNGALEIVAYMGEDASASVTEGAAVMVEGDIQGVITSIAPALDPVTKQIELHVAVDAASGLVNGQSVRVTLPGALASDEETTNGPALLPLSAVKLTAGNRVVFSLGEDSRLRALSVEIGEVVGERIEVRTALPADLRIVTDARGLSDGQQVNVAETP